MYIYMYVYAYVCFYEDMNVCMCVLKSVCL